MLEKPVIKIAVDLLHIEENRVFVKVTAFSNGLDIGSSIGEGPTAEAAENKAIKRIYERLEYSKDSFSDKQGPNKSFDEQNKSNETIVEDPPQDPPSKNSFNPKLKNIMVESKANVLEEVPEDWSNILAEYDQELFRIGWDKESENKFLMNNFNLSSRDRITNYNSIRILLQILKMAKKGDSAENKTKYSDRDYLISESNKLIKRLGWDNNKGRDYLYNNFNTKSRNELSHLNLLTFNFMLVENISKNQQNS